MSLLLDIDATVLEDSSAVVKGRERAYSWLSEFYLVEPSAKLMKTHLKPKLMNTLVPVIGDISSSSALWDLKSLANSMSVEAIRDEYYSLFVVPTMKTYVPPYESCFREKTENNYGNLWGKASLDVLRFYREVGLDVTYPRYIFAPDHIGLELAYMSKLCHIELHLASRRSHEVNRIRDLQICFLERHISTWANEFLSEIQRSTVANFFKQIAIFTKRVLEQDLKYNLVVNG